MPLLLLSNDGCRPHISLSTALEHGNSQGRNRRRMKGKEDTGAGALPGVYSITRAFKCGSCLVYRYFSTYEEYRCLTARNAAPHPFETLLANDWVPSSCSPVAVHSLPPPPQTLVQILDGSLMVLVRLLAVLLGSGERRTHGTPTYQTLYRPPLAHSRQLFCG